TCPLPDHQAFAAKGRFGAHNIHENVPRPTAWHSDQIVLGTFFNGGLRAYDISNPYQPQQVGVFVPPAPPMAPTGTIQLSDVFVVTGVHGAGKTTLLRRFLGSPAGEGTAVVINEFGSVGIDDALVRASSDDVTLLGNGCLCCNMRSDLQNALRNLLAERAHGTVPQFKRVLIETSGLADPGPIL